MPVGIPCREIDLREVRVRTQRFIHYADALKKIAPVQRGHQTHARNDVPHRYVHGRLLLMLEANDFIGGGLLRGQPFIEPLEHRTHVRIQIAQALKKFHGECIRERPVVELFQQCFGCDRRITAQSEQAVSESVGLLPRRPAPHDSFDDTPEVFHEDDSDGDRHGPKLANRQGLHALVRSDEAPQNFGIEIAVGMGHEGPRHPENAGIALQKSGR